MKTLLEKLIIVTMLGTVGSPIAFAESLQCQHHPAHIIILRHGCKADQTDMSPLCPSGHAQAVELIERLKKYAVNVIYVTEKPRSLDTASELAKYRGLTPVNPPLKATGSAARKLIEDICSDPESEGKSILYVGHSNTIGDALTALGLKPTIPDYGEGWVVSFRDGKPIRKPTKSKIKCDSEKCVH